MLNVSKNERGQVDVWSEKCLPPGTVHLRLPRLFQVAKRLGIDYAPAMVGFDYRSGRCLPVFDGIVVCTEFQSAILEVCLDGRTFFSICVTFHHAVIMIYTLSIV
jgi:xeroderma pigmentosum group C-complementing protein